MLIADKMKSLRRIRTWGSGVSRLSENKGRLRAREGNGRRVVDRRIRRSLPVRVALITGLFLPSLSGVVVAAESHIACDTTERECTLTLFRNGTPLAEQTIDPDKVDVSALLRGLIIGSEQFGARRAATLVSVATDPGDATSGAGFVDGEGCCQNSQGLAGSDPSGSWVGSGSFGWNPGLGVGCDPTPLSVSPQLIGPLRMITCATNFAEANQKCFKDCREHCSTGNNRGVKSAVYDDRDSCGTRGTCSCECWGPSNTGGLDPDTPNL